MKTNMRHIHTSIVSSHLATRGKILRTLSPHISISDGIVPRQLRTNKSPSSNHTYTKSTPNHIHHHYTSSVTPTHTRHTSSLQLHTHMYHVVTPGFVDKPRWSDGTASQMDGKSGWWTTSGKVGLPH